MKNILVINGNQADVQHYVNIDFGLTVILSKIPVDKRKNLVYSENIEKAFTK